MYALLIGIFSNRISQGPKKRERSVSFDMEAGYFTPSVNEFGEKFKTCASHT